MASVNHIDITNFDKNLANIVLCTPAIFPYMPLEEAFYSLKLQPTHGFIRHREIMGERSYDREIMTNSTTMFEFDALK